MAFDQERAVVKRLRAAMKQVRLAIEEANDSVNQYNGLGALAFSPYYADASWSTDNPDVTSANFTGGVASLQQFVTLWLTSNAPNVGPHETPINQAGNP